MKYYPRSLLPSNPKQVLVGKRKWWKRGPRTPEGRQRMREAALRNKPWLHSTGPRTPEGKARAAANGRRRQKGEMSVRQLRAAVADVGEMVKEMATLRNKISPRTGEGG